MGNIPVGQADELQVGVRVGRQAAPGERVRLTAKATARNSTSYSASATDVVVALPKAPASSPSANPTTTVTLPAVTLPPLAGSGISPSNPSGLFPTVGPGPSQSATPLGLPPVKPRRTVRATDAAATVPLDSRLIGGQLAGLAVLAAAVVTAIARLSLRPPKPAGDKGNRQPAG